MAVQCLSSTYACLETSSPRPSLSVDEKLVAFSPDNAAPVLTSSQTRAHVSHAFLYVFIRSRTHAMQENAAAARVLKIGGSSRVKNIAGAIAHVTRAGGPPKLLALGARFVAQTLTWRLIHQEIRYICTLPSSSRTCMRAKCPTDSVSSHHCHLSDDVRMVVVVCVQSREHLRQSDSHREWVSRQRQHFACGCPAISRGTLM